MSHPSYLKMVQAAITSSWDSGKGVKRKAIVDYIEDNHPLGLASGSRLHAAIGRALQQGVEKGLFEIGDKRCKGDNIGYKLCIESKKKHKKTKKTKSYLSPLWSTDSDQESAKNSKKKKHKKKKKKMKSTSSPLWSIYSDQESEQEKSEYLSLFTWSMDSDQEEAKNAKKKKHTKKKRHNDVVTKSSSSRKWKTATCCSCDKDCKLCPTDYALIVEQGVGRPFCRQCMKEERCSNCFDNDSSRMVYCRKCGGAICPWCRGENGKCSHCQSWNDRGGSF